MPKKNLQVIYYLIALAIVVITGYIASFSDWWMISVLITCGAVLLVIYIANSKNKHKKQEGNSHS